MHIQNTIIPSVLHLRLPISDSCFKNLCWIMLMYFASSPLFTSESISYRNIVLYFYATWNYSGYIKFGMLYIWLQYYTSHKFRLCCWMNHLLCQLQQYSFSWSWRRPVSTVASLFSRYDRSTFHITVRYLMASFFSDLCTWIIAINCLKTFPLNANFIVRKTD
jgi:hypothetical protein